MITYGYARVSSTSQNLDRQTAQLVSAGVDERNIFADKVSGAKEHRPALDKLLDTLKEGDTLVVVSLDRLARSTKQCLDLAERFQKEGVNLVSLKERIDTSTPTGMFFFTISSAYAQLERSLIKERQAEGIAVAKAHGKRLGREPIPKERMETAVELYETGDYTVAEVVRKTGVNRSSLYRYLKANGITR